MDCKQFNHGVLTSECGHLNLSFAEVLDDYKMAFQSREAALLGRRECLSGKAKFGIFGDGKEIPQVVLAKLMQKGDFRSGYYRDQTLMLALGHLSLTTYFTQLYGIADVELDPDSAGRQMNSAYSTRLLDENGCFKNMLQQVNSAPDLAPTAGHMPRTLGLAYASKLYRLIPELQHKSISEKYSQEGNEVIFGTIGNASTSEGHFFEAMNAAGVLGVPLVMSVWDDGYGISVPAKFHTIKESISKALKGFHLENGSNGFYVYEVDGRDYLDLHLKYKEAINIAREKHIPILMHITNLTQQTGHSTSGSHERYKSEERLAWERENDGLKILRTLILENQMIKEECLKHFEEIWSKEVKDCLKEAYERYLTPLKKEFHSTFSEVVEVLRSMADKEVTKELGGWIQELKAKSLITRKEIASLLYKIYAYLRKNKLKEYKNIYQFYLKYKEEGVQRYSSYLYSDEGPLQREKFENPVIYSETSEKVDGRMVVRKCFEELFKREPRLFAIGEDIGVLGGVNLAFEGLQQQFGEWRVSDTGIREATILGQGIGAAMRGLRPLVDIQYLDYLLYAFQTMTDDLATLHWRSAGGTKAPVIIRTKGHRLEGIWHSGSPMGTLLNGLRGIYVCVPRDMTRAAGFYNTLFASENAALVIEPLNGYRVKETMPDNISTFTLPLGIPEILKEGNDITVVTYGSTCKIVLEAAFYAQREFSISIEVIDAQTLIPFDTENIVGKSLQKTAALLIVDEDVPGGASAYLLQKILEEHDNFYELDAKPRTITGSDHRPAYTSDGDYFSKPNVEDIVNAFVHIMEERNQF